MKKIQHILSITCVLLIGYPCATLAQDSTFNRVVTVERDYQPEISHANIIPVQPSVLQVDVNPNPVVYSTYSNPLSISHNLYPLEAAETKFTAPTPLNGHIEGAIGHQNTRVDFMYEVHEKKNFSASVYAKHNANWGCNTLSNSQIGAEGTYHFKKANLYFGLVGENEYFSYYGRYYNGSHKLPALTIKRMGELQVQDWTSLYQATAYVGIRANKYEHFQYKIQTGYKAFFAPNIIEHQVQSYLDMYWAEGQHQGGVKVYVQNNLYTNENNLSNTIHNIRIQPFYALNENKIRLQVGVNLDLNIGTEQMLSANQNISFAPSPNVKMEWLIVPKVLNLHTEIEGGLGRGIIAEGLQTNRYLDIHELATRREARRYTPVSANLGLMVHPLRTMVIDIYGGYSLYKNDFTMKAICDPSSSAVNRYSYLLHDYQRGHVGASLHYHYRDILSIKAKGNYYFWKNLSEDLPVYDRPDWDASLRIDAHINRKWSLYSDNHFEGGRIAYTTNGDKKLPAVIDLNIGAQYAINRWLNVYLQVGNYLHRANYTYYGYPSQGCHFLVGVKYAF